MTMVKRDREKAAEIVRDAGGEVVGRTRLQKIAYLLELTGQGAGFDFEYRHYGPYSETLSNAIHTASVFDLIEEENHVAQWGGHYSIYKLGQDIPGTADPSRVKFATTAASISPIELELAATAAYLKVVEGYSDPWEETKRRKPEKADDERLRKAKEAYQQLSALDVPNPLPSIT